MLGGSDAVTKLCKECTHVTDESHCTSTVKCMREERCRTTVEYRSGQYLLSKGCARHHDSCHSISASVIGIGRKRDIHQEGTLVCQRCCSTSYCNRDDCGQFFVTTTTAPPTTTTLAPCRDHEFDGFKCSEYAEFCTDTTHLAHKLAWERCPKYCGFCDASGQYLPTTSQPAPTTTEPTTTTVKLTTTAAMTDGTQAPTTMAAMPTTTAQMPTTMAPMPTTTAAMAPTAPTTAAMMPTSATDSSVDQSSVGPGMTTTIGMVPTTTTASDCVDKEDPAFSCQQWASYGFCSDNTGTGHDI